MKNRTLIVIPARLGSWRFPNKPIEDIHGKPMIEHVYRRAQMVENVSEIVIATCDEEVAVVAKKFGAKVVMTSKICPTACERVGEAAKILGFTNYDDVVINVQGDEPMVPPPVIEITRQRLLSSPDNLVANMVERIRNDEDLTNPNRIKAILTQKDNLMFLSRECIPAKIFDIKKLADYYLLTCITAYRGTFLTLFSELKRTPVELIEGNDMMRTLEHEIKIVSGLISQHTHPVDTPEDIEAVKKLILDDPWYSKYDR
ncbi:MAG: 3-deoxy-manno-octulosonate cytidylyltransferase [Bacteriovorax sp.]|jgi:3-deoxy-manno-octulosonate cytidylyltransferase (CMP-KDO synthetase)